MPFINVKTNVSLDDTAKNTIESRRSKAISLIPGKSEAWLMLAFEDNMSMYFKGDNSADYAYVEVSLFGGASDAAYDRLTAAISEIISETLGIDSSNIYIKYEEAEHWGWNGSNF